MTTASSTASTLRTAIVGCGQIADAHLQELRKLRGIEIVGVCDVHHDLAIQAAARFGVPEYFNDIDALIDRTRPDVVHLTTPAHTHAPLAIQLLNRGCHVYVEKPVALDARECSQIFTAAAERQRLVCVGHDQLYDPMWLACRRRIAAGEIGDVRHVESLLGYPIGGQFGALVAADPKHWVRRLPGGLFQNTISHPLYRITDLLPDPSPQIHAVAFSRGGATFPTDLRVELIGRDVTGTLIFDTGIQPQRITRVHGTRGSLEVDFEAQTIATRRAARLPGAFAKLELPYRASREAARNLRRNIARFVRSDIHYFAGMGNLFAEFYSAIRDGRQSPVLPEEVQRVTRIMDTIFDQCMPRLSGEPAVEAEARAAQELAGALH